MTLSDLITETLKEVLAEEQKNGCLSRNNNQQSTFCNQSGKKRVITEAFVDEELRAGRTIDIQQGDIITPLAKDMLRAKGII